MFLQTCPLPGLFYLDIANLNIQGGMIDTALLNFDSKLCPNLFDFVFQAVCESNSISPPFAVACLCCAKLYLHSLQFWR